MNMLFTNYWAPVKNKRIQLHGMQILQVNIYFIKIYREYGLIFYKNTLFCALEYDALLVDVL